MQAFTAFNLQNITKPKNVPVFLYKRGSRFYSYVEMKRVISLSRGTGHQLGDFLNNIETNQPFLLVHNQAASRPRRQLYSYSLPGGVVINPSDPKKELGGPVHDPEGRTSTTHNDL